MKKLVGRLKVTNVPSGVKKWQLPIVLDGKTGFYISAWQADTVIPKHSHEEGAGIRFVLEGSVLYGNVELVTGDWIYIPGGVEYSLGAGERGAVVISGYECCCR
jgi:hypothetical protein